MNKKGFTLIELLIVITIIGVLAVALLPRIVGIPARGRDTARVASINQVVTALQSYYNDFGEYPAGDNSNTCLPASLNKYLGGSLPKDPQTGRKTGDCPTAGLFYYKRVKNNGVDNQSFIVASDLETDGGGDNYYDYAVLKAITDLTTASPPATLPKANPGKTGAANVYAVVR